MPMTPETESALVDYFRAREQERTERRNAMWEALTPREQALVREAATMAFVRGTMRSSEAIPKVSAIVADVLTECDGMPDLYPTISHLGDQ
jgi:hypothetical protein